MSTLVGWAGGDSFKCVLIVMIPVATSLFPGRFTFSCKAHHHNSKSVLSFSYQSIVVISGFVTHAPCSHFALFLVIVLQRLVYGNAPPSAALLADDEELEEALALAS